MVKSIEKAFAITIFGEISKRQHTGYKACFYAYSTILENKNRMENKK